MLRNLFLPLGMLGCLLVLSSCSRVGPPSAVERPGVSKTEKITTHIVKEGETTLLIAKMYNMREDELVYLNKIAPPFKVVVGQKLKVKPNSKSKTVDPSFDRVQEEQDVEVVALNVDPQADAMAGGQAAASATAAGAGAMSQPAIQPFSPPAGSPAVEQMAVNPKGWQAPVTKGTVLYRFGEKLPNGTVCDGTTWKAPLGTPVMAASDGTVLKAGQEIPAYGNMVVIKHADGKLSVYAHLKQIDKGIKLNKPVSKGQMIGQVGKTGQVNDTQLHFQVRNNDARKTAVDPLTLLS